jgi:hypothetical protein
MCPANSGNMRSIVLAGNGAGGELLGTGDGNGSRRWHCEWVVSEMEIKGLGKRRFGCIPLSSHWREGLGGQEGGRGRTRTLSGPMHRQPKFGEWIKWSA